MRSILRSTVIKALKSNVLSYGPKGVEAQNENEEGEPEDINVGYIENSDGQPIKVYDSPFGVNVNTSDGQSEESLNVYTRDYHQHFKNNKQFHGCTQGISINLIIEIVVCNTVGYGNEFRLDELEEKIRYRLNALLTFSPTFYIKDCSISAFGITDIRTLTRPIEGDTRYRIRHLIFTLTYPGECITPYIPTQETCYKIANEFNCEVTND